VGWRVPPCWSCFCVYRESGDIYISSSSFVFFSLSFFSSSSPSSCVPARQRDLRGRRRHASAPPSQQSSGSFHYFIALQSSRGGENRNVAIQLVPSLPSSLFFSLARIEEVRMMRFDLLGRRTSIHALSTYPAR